MPIDAASNPWTEVENELAGALPHLAGFQRFCRLDPLDPDVVDDAGGFVFLDDLGKPLVGEVWSLKQINEARCWAIVASSERDGYRFDRTSADGFSCSGNLTLILDRVVPPADEDGQEDQQTSGDQLDRWMKNCVGDIMQELAQYWDEGGGPYLMAAAVVDGPYQNHPDEWETKGHRQGAEVAIAWGVRGGGGVGN